MSEPTPQFLECIARALWLADTSEGWTDNPDERMSDTTGLLVTWRDYKDMARAAIAAYVDWD